jgi:membrane-bound lytic murein transglycosylase D
MARATVFPMSISRFVAAGAGFSLLLTFSPAGAADPPQAVKPAKAAVSKTASKTSSKGGRGMDASARRAIAGGPTADEASLGVETPELRQLRDAERELFPPAAPVPGNVWPSELPFIAPLGGEPQVRASGVPPSEPAAPVSPDLVTHLSWLAQLEMPDLPVRWDERVVRYLEFFREDPRGHAMFANLFRRSGRFHDMMRRALRRKALPQDLVWVSMIESGFDPIARSPSGAAGLWQFMPETAKIYGLLMDRWLDQRYSVELATTAAADLLGDLHRRFGSWELALAAYNMGYAGVASVLRRYNTNDFWSLARTEAALPWETTLYVPKILAASVVAHNLVAFGFGDLVPDSPADADQVDVAPGMSFALVAQAAGCDAKDIEALNPEFRAARTPPAADGDAHYPLKVPMGKGGSTAQGLARLRRDQPPLDRYVVRFGETLDQVAASHKTTPQKLVELNAIAPAEALRGGTLLLVPKVDAQSSAAADVPSPGRGPPAGGAAAPTAPKQSVIVPLDEFSYPDRQRVFYRVLVGDTLKEIAGALRVAVDDLRRWNDLDAGARLQEGMTLQAFVAADADLSHIVVLREREVHVLAVGSDEFFASLEREKRFRRVTVVAKTGDTLEVIGKRFDVSARLMERINRRGRGDALKGGEAVVVYAPAYVEPSSAGTVTAANAAPPVPLPAPPVPNLLPQ